MAFYTDSTVVDAFVHEGVEVQIHVAMKGPVHCDLPHEPDATACQGCGAEIAAATVFFPVINNAIIDGIECPTETEARELAVDLVSRLNDGRDRGEFIIIDIEDDDTDPVPPPPKAGAENDDATDGHHANKARIKIMHKLGWPGMFNEIFDRLGLK